MKRLLNRFREYSNNKSAYANYAEMALFFALIVLCYSINWILGTCAVLLYFAYRIFEYWDNYMMAVRYGETALFGKPLDKEYWGKKEKIKMKRLVWKKK